ncbi:MAG: 2-oxoacid:acceptor oxidoreductase family protein [bacterium]|nr:2-oxoacid:acceptor oxidoreductase family protein [bacterium]
MLMEVVMAGFGGQGLMLIGKLLAEASMDEGKEVSWLPSYGPEMRGGTANCTVVVSDTPVASPVINMPQSLLVMNRQSLEKFGPLVKPGGLVLVNSSLIPITTGRTDVHEVRIPCTMRHRRLARTKMRK